MILGEVSVSNERGYHVGARGVRKSTHQGTQDSTCLEITILLASCTSLSRSHTHILALHLSHTHTSSLSSVHWRSRHSLPVRTESWPGPPRGKWAPRVEIHSTSCQFTPPAACPSTYFHTSTYSPSTDPLPSEEGTTSRIFKGLLLDIIWP